MKSLRDLRSDVAVPDETVPGSPVEATRGEIKFSAITAAVVGVCALLGLILFLLR